MANYKSIVKMQALDMLMSIILLSYVVHVYIYICIYVYIYISKHLTVICHSKLVIVIFAKYRGPHL